MAAGVSARSLTAERTESDLSGPSAYFYLGWGAEKASKRVRTPSLGKSPQREGLLLGKRKKGHSPACKGHPWIDWNGAPPGSPLRVGGARTDICFRRRTKGSTDVNLSSWGLRPYRLWPTGTAGMPEGAAG